jgi:peptidoglycan/LPS O-acetylase OafA/YrhL
MHFSEPDFKSLLMEKTVPGNASHPRYRQLDSLRGLGAVSVFFAHFIGLKISLPLLHTIQQSPFGILFNGTAALMLFFVLSGFVLSLPFVDSGKPLKLTSFYIKRVFRIYPAYIFAVIFAVLLKEFLFDREGLAPYVDWIKNFWAWDWNKENFREILKTFLNEDVDYPALFYNDHCTRQHNFKYCLPVCYSLVNF